MDHAEHVRGLLRQVCDPELGVNIVDLGLIYDIRVGSDAIYVRMTLTVPGCPMHDTIVGGVKRVLGTHMPDKEVNVDVVWEPPWSPNNMSKEAKEQLGFR